MTERIKILYVITKSSWGGAQRYVYDLATSLPKDKFDVAVVVGGDGLLVKRLVKENIRVIPVPNLNRNVYLMKDLKSFSELQKIFKNERPDIIHLNSSKAGGIGALAARFAHTPRIIFTAHGWAFNEKRPLWQRIIIYASYVAIIILTDKTICVSNSVFRDMHNARGINYKLQVITLGIKKPTYRTKEASKKKLLIEGERKIIGMIAELHPTKRIEDAIVAIGKLRSYFPDILLLVFGEGEHRKILERKIIKYNLQNNIQLLGFVQNAYKYSKAFDVFLFPSKTEGLGYALLEVGAAGIPVVASRVGGIPEVITDEASGILITPEHPDDIVIAVRRLLNNKDLSDRIGKTLAERVRRGFIFEQMVSDTIKAYNID